MAKVLVSESNLTNIANAIRTKNGSSNTYTPAQMATAISNIPTGGGITPTGSINITTNGTHDVTNYASAVVNVPTGGGSSSEYHISYPTSTPNQTLGFSYTNRHTKSNGVLTMKMDSVTISLTPNTGYLAGNVVINGVDRGASSVTTTLQDGDVITVTAAEEKVISEYNLDTVMTVGYDFQTGCLGYSTSYNIGSLRDDTMWYYSYSGQTTPSTTQVTEFYVNAEGSGANLHSAITINANMGSPVSANVYIGDSSTSNYWTFTIDYFPYGRATANIYLCDYLDECYNNNIQVPVKILLSSNPS